jgi:hypothetical protein
MSTVNISPRTTSELLRKVEEVLKSMKRRMKRPESYFAAWQQANPISEKARPLTTRVPSFPPQAPVAADLVQSGLATPERPQPPAVDVRIGQNQPRVA